MEVFNIKFRTSYDNYSNIINVNISLTLDLIVGKYQVK